jgi:glucosamine-phosphate N-acetyltransferase
MNCRPLVLTDYDKGFFELLSQLTFSPTVSFEKFSHTFESIEQNGNTHVMVIEDSVSGTIIGCGTIVIEQKYIHGCGCIGHIEDVVVHKDYRKQRIGNNIVEHLLNIGKDKNCYKVILDCSTENVKFYMKCGLKKSHSENMVLYLT